MRLLCLIFAASILSSSLSGQAIGDSIIIYIENRVELKVAVPDYSNLQTPNQVTNGLEQFLELLPEVSSQLSSSSGDLIQFSVGNQLTLEPGDQKVTFMIKDGVTSNTGFRDKAIITGENFVIFITTTDLSRVSDIPLSECLEKVIAKLPDKANMSRSLYYQCVEDKVLELENKHHNNGRLDFLEINLGAGAGLVKNNWVADLSFAVGIGIVKKGEPKYHPYVSTNLIFDFDDEGSIDLNMFLNLGYRPNIVKDTKKSTFLGIELGYLIVDQGELFEDNTFRLGVNWSPLKGVFVGPQLYATDNFNKVFPGIRIGFGI